MAMVTEAFPIIVFTKQLENKKRKIMEIMECEILPGGRQNFRTLYQYKIRENYMEEDRFVIQGEHERLNAMSAGLQKRLLENGMSRVCLNRLQGKEDNECLSYSLCPA